MQEEFRDVEGYEGLYQVSNLGRIKILQKEVLRNGKYPFISKEKIAKQSIDGYGYFVVTFSKDLKQKVFKVHKLVAINFLGHKPCKYEIVVDHINNNKSDNRLENLQLISQRENVNKDRGKESSKYIGVSWDKGVKKWRSQIYFNNKHFKIGWFSTEIEASNAYQNKLKELNEL